MEQPLTPHQSLCYDSLLIRCAAGGELLSRQRACSILRAQNVASPESSTSNKPPLLGHHRFEFRYIGFAGLTDHVMPVVIG